jgi:hypothetical protein
MDDEVLWALREREKELRCLYRVIEALAMREEPPHAVFDRVLAAIPDGWQFPEETTARIEYFGRTHAAPHFVETPWRQHSPISMWRTPVGSIEVIYRSEKAPAWEGPFLKEERQLLDNIALRIGEYLEWKQRELSGERIGAAPEHWRWRQRFAERIAASIDPSRFGVEKIYLYGSAESGNAGPSSDIDLMVVHGGDEQKKQQLLIWLEGWSLCLAELSFQLQGLPSSGMLDVRLLSKDEAADDLRALARAGTPPRELPLATSRASSSR